MTDHVHQAWRLSLFLVAALSLSLFLLSDASGSKGLTVSTDSRSYSNGDMITISGSVEDREPGASVLVEVTDPHGDRVWGESATVTALNVYEVEIVAGEPQYSFSEHVMDDSGIYLVTVSYFTPDSDLLQEETTFEFTTDSGSDVSNEEDRIVVVELDKAAYEIGDSMLLTGKVEGNTDQFITITVTDPSGAVSGVDQFRPNTDGSFDYSLTFSGQQAEAGLWTIDVKFDMVQKTLNLELQDEDQGEVTLPLRLAAIKAQDTTGNDIGNHIRQSQQIMLAFNSDNIGNSAQSYVALIQVSAQDGSTDYLTWQTGTASVGEVSNFGFAWQPEEVGTYTVKAFLWTSLDSPTALSEPSETQLTVDSSDDNQFITTTTVTLDIGETNPTGTFKLTGVSPDSVTGLQYYDYPVGGGPGIAVGMTLGQQVTNGCTVTVKLLSINHASQQATFEQTVDSDPNRMCPICWWQLEVMDTSTATRV